ncbi:MAG: hypothetical protein WCT50_01320 [Patescibacteria group bacterium]|jgi:glycosyltransferase involved in cell wall biosynthesis
MIEQLNLNKKILLLSSWAPPKIGGAQNLYNIFANINPDDYCILTSKQNLKGKEGKFGTKLECDYFFYDEETKNFIIDPELPKKRYYYFIKKFSFIFKAIKNLASLLKFLLVSLSLINKIIKQGKEITKNKKIDLIIGLSDVEINLVSTLILSKILKKPFAIYLFDLYYGNQLSFPYNAIAKFAEPIIFKTAKNIIVTNGATKDYYLNKYGMEEKYTIIHNCVFPENYENIIPTTIKKTDDKISIVFTGNIYWPQETSLDNLLKLINNNQTENIEISIYCPSPPTNLINKYQDNKKIKFTAAAQSDMPRIQSEADILFLPLSWNTEAPDIIRTASPGKLTDYLISGRPILIHAPKYSFIAKYGKENNFAEVVDEENIDKLKIAIDKLSNNHIYSKQLVLNAASVFYRNHDARTNAKKFTQIINNI